MARRKFLAGMAATAAGSMAGGLGVFTQPAAAMQLQKDQKRIIVFYMYGGLSQLESWDPKPGTDTGGPFRSIETSVPGVRISELLPGVARQMHHLCLVRGINTGEDDHGKGQYLLLTGRRKSPAADYPALGAVCAKVMAPEEDAMPGHIVLLPWGRQRPRQRLGLPRAQVLEHPPRRGEAAGVHLEARSGQRVDGCRTQ